MSNFREPWTVKEATAPRLGAKPAWHLHDCHNGLIHAQGNGLKELNERIAACVNFCAGIDNKALTESNSDFLELVKACIQNPNELTYKLILKDEIEAIASAHVTEEMYIPRRMLIELLDSIVRDGNWHTRNHEILLAIGVKCKAYILHNGTKYPCEKGWFTYPKGIINWRMSTRKGIAWRSTEQMDRIRCETCNGTGLILPSQVDIQLPLPQLNLDTNVHPNVDNP